MPSNGKHARQASEVRARKPTTAGPLKADFARSAKSFGSAVFAAQAWMHLLPGSDSAELSTFTPALIQ